MSVIVKPEAGAAELMTTDPDAVLPPAIEAGETLIEVRFGALTVRLPVAVPPPSEAEIVAVTVVPTGTVLTENVPLKP